MRGLTVTFAVVRGFGVAFRCTGGLAIAFAVVRGFEIIVPRVNADDTREMIIKQDFELSVKQVGDLFDYEWVASLPSFLDDTEESNTELGGIQIELDTAEITYKNYVTETEESNMKCDDILSYTDSKGFKKELCTKNTDDDYESTKYSYDDKRLADGVSMAQATTRYLTITIKINKFWKLHELVDNVEHWILREHRDQILADMDSFPALRLKFGICNLQAKASIMRECENISGTFGFSIF